MANELKLTKAVIYCRVSSAKQATEGHGLDSQESRCRDYARAKGYEVEACFPDDASGGGDFMKRPGMVALLAYLAGKGDTDYVVIFDDLKRFARDTMFHWKLRYALAAHNAKVECLNFKFDDTPEGEFMETLFAAQGQLERQQNSRQTIQKMKARVSNGYWTSNPVVGYRFEKVEGHGKMLVRDEPRATIVQTALEGFASKRFPTQTDVKLYLESQIPFPKNKDGKVLYQRVTDLLKRVLYAGYITLPSWGVHLLPAKHEPIISYETFQHIQERLAEQAKEPTRKIRNDEFPLRGFVLCCGCNKPLTSTWSKGQQGKKYPYYFCHRKPCPNHGKSVRREKLEEAFEKLLIELRPVSELYNLGYRTCKTLWNDRKQQSSTDASSIEAEQRNVEVQIEKLMNRIMVTENSAVVARYEDRINELEKSKRLLAEKIQSCGTVLPDFDTNFQTSFAFLADPYKLWATGCIHRKKTVLQLVFAEKLPYDLNTGFQTPQKSLPFSLLDDLGRGNYEVVPRRGLEPPRPFDH